MNVLGLVAPSAVASCWDLPVSATGIQSAEIAADSGRVVIGLPEAGRAFVLSTELGAIRDLRPPSGGDFANGPGFGASVALDHDIVSVGAVRVGGAAPGIEQPAGVFHTGAVFTFDLKSGALLWQEISDRKRVFGHSLSINEGVVGFGIYEAPEPDGGSVRLPDAARGSVALRSPDGAPLLVIGGPADARGFGATLSGSAPLITVAADPDARGIWALQDGTAILLASMPATLNGIPATYLAAEGSTVAVSAAGGFTSSAGRTMLMTPGSPTHEIEAGGPVALSTDRLAVLVRAAPEDQRHNKLVIYKISKNDIPVEVATINHVIGATLDGETAFAALAEPGAPIRLCAKST